MSSRDAESVLALLRRIEGLDVDAGLAMTGGRIAPFTRALARFAATYRDGVPTWLDTSGNEQEGVIRWRAACHSARGALTTIGANDLSQKVAALEQSLTETGARAANLGRVQLLQQQFARIVGSLLKLNLQQAPPRP